MLLHGSAFGRGFYAWHTRAYRTNATDIVPLA